MNEFNPASPRPAEPPAAPGRASRRHLAPLLVTLVLWAAVALASSDGVVTLDDAGRPEPRRGGTLHFAQEQISTLDPQLVSDVYSGTVCFQVFRGLIAFGTNLTPMPELAESWTISRDGLDYNFKLRAGVRFHNGREMTANDVVYSLHRIFRPDGELGLAGQFLEAIDGAMDYHQRRAPLIRGVSATGPLSVAIRLSRPDAHFLWALALVQASIVPREEIQRLGEAGFARHPVGCGPFQLIQATDEEIRLVAFGGYYRRRAWVDSLIFHTPLQDDPVRRSRELLAGQYDIAEIPGSMREAVSASPAVQLISRRELMVSFLGLNTRIPPLDNPLVRQAMAMTVDRAAVVKLNPAGQIPANGIIPPGVSCYSPEIKVYPHDPDAARALLARAGHPGGRGLPRVRYCASRGSTRSRAVDSLLVNSWRQIGLNVAVERLDWVKLQQALDDGEVPVFSLSWIADIPDPDSFMGSLLASTSPTNYFRYRNAEVDSLIAIGRTRLDPRARQQIYDRAERLALRDAPLIPLYTATSAYGLRVGVHGLELTPLGISCVDLANVWIEEAADEHAGLE